MENNTYPDTPIHSDIDSGKIQHDDPAAVEEAKKWSTDAMRTIILPTKDLSDLENQWIKFNMMIKKNRRESDWKSIELFGATNQMRYEKMKDELLMSDIDDMIDVAPQIDDSSITESYVTLDPADSYYDADAVNYSTSDVEKAKEWAKDSNRIIIIPTRTLDELESLWDSYNMMIKKHRRESDWMSLDLFGLTNLKHYEYLKSQFLKQDVNNSKDYNMYIEAVTTNNMKKYINSVCLNESSSESTKLLIDLLLPHKNIYEEVIVNNIISDALDSFDGELTNACQNVQIPYGDMPYLSPDEMIDMGVYGQSHVDNYFDAVADNTMINEDVSVKEWFEMYKAFDDGFYTEMGDISSDWVNKVRELSYELNKMIESGADESVINSRKQSLLELGWNPYIDFNNKSRSIARESAYDRMSAKSTTTKFVDLKEFVKHNSEDRAISEASLNQNFQPVYIVLVEGKSQFSSTIKSITKCIYSHAAIAFDHTLEHMYSYGFQERKHPGFGEEKIENIPKGSRIRVYTFFVSKQIKEKLESTIDKFKKNIDKTRYSYKNLFTYIFNIPYENDWNMICSQFVDRCLKLVGIDMTKKSSSLVSPKMLDDCSKNESRIYDIYDGKWEKYNPSKVANTVNSLRSKAKPLKEQQTMYYVNEVSYINGIIDNIYNIPALQEMQTHFDIVETPIVRSILENILFDSIQLVPYCEAKTFPIQFDTKGNLIIKNTGKLDYAGEYAKSHKLLKEYLKANNVDGMKYELAKLWMMNSMIEEKINSKKFKDLPSAAIESSAEMKTRPNIINDFKYYIGKVMEKDPSFNFTKYFEESPFNYKETKISNSTISFMTKLIKKFIKPI